MSHASGPGHSPALDRLETERLARVSILVPQSGVCLAEEEPYQGCSGQSHSQQGARSRVKVPQGEACFS